MMSPMAKICADIAQLLIDLDKTFSLIADPDTFGADK